MEIKHRTQLVELLMHLNLPLIGIEVGVAEGLNSKDLIVAGMQKLYMVDNWSTIDGQTGDGGYDQAWHDKNYNAACDRVDTYDAATILRGKSKVMSRYIDEETIGLVYLDGDHSREGVKSDLEVYWHKLVPGGIMAGHDYLNPSYGVNAAVKEFAVMNGLEIHVIAEHKMEDAGFWMQKPLK